MTGRQRRAFAHAQETIAEEHRRALARLTLDQLHAIALVWTLFDFLASASRDRFDELTDVRRLAIAFCPWGWVGTMMDTAGHLDPNRAVF